MKRLWYWFVDNILPIEVLTDWVELEGEWRLHETKAVRRLGTLQEAHESLQNLKGLNHEVNHEIGAMRQHSLLLGHDEAVGDPKDVHVLLPPQHAFGYAIEETPDDYRRETFETVDARLIVMRRRGNAIGFHRMTIMRMEKRGPIRYG